MEKRKLFVLFFVLFSINCDNLPVDSEDNGSNTQRFQGAEYFPLKQGNKWTYKLTVIKDTENHIESGTIGTAIIEVVGSDGSSFFLKREYLTGNTVFAEEYDTLKIESGCIVKYHKGEKRFVVADFEAEDIKPYKTYFAFEKRWVLINSDLFAMSWSNEKLFKDHYNEYEYTPTGGGVAEKIYDYEETYEKGIGITKAKIYYEFGIIGNSLGSGYKFKKYSLEITDYELN